MKTWKDIYGSIYDQNDNQICDLNSAHEDVESNAKLIAAAPEMLEALQELGQFWLEPKNKENGKANRMRVKIESLINKATL